MNDSASTGPIAPGDGHVVFPCQTCGRLFVSPAFKVGRLVTCPTCGRIGRTVGIALQPRVTPRQLQEVQSVAARLSVALALIVVPLVLTVAIFALERLMISNKGGPVLSAVWTVAGFVFAAIWVIALLLLIMTAGHAARLLGRPSVVYGSLCIIPLSIVVAAVILIRIWSRASVLRAAGTR